MGESGLRCAGTVDLTRRVESREPVQLIYIAYQAERMERKEDVMMMKKSAALWAALLAVVLLVAACGPAVTEEEAVELTRQAESGDVTEEGGAETEAAGEVAPELDPVAPAGPGLPEVDGPSTVTDSGLEYIETRAGDGEPPNEGDILTMQLVGMLEDGTRFADTYADGQPIIAPLTELDLFEGWREGMLLMNVGGAGRLIIPPELAFGDQGAGGIIPPNATIILDVELVSAEAPPEPATVDAGDLTTTDSGLQYFDLVEGDGDQPEQGQDVVVEYRVWLQDGNTFIASSADDGQPLTFTLGSEQGVLPGWDEGVATMNVGGTRYLVIPPDLALGETGGGRIPPNATLIMEVELLDALPLRLPTEVPESDFTVTDSGLQYFDLVEGDGESPAEGDFVTVDYTGWTTDNVKFDSSLDAGVPFTFQLGTGGVIQGWDEGVADMRVGGTRQLVIPAELAYGDTGAGAQIPPGATLIFEVTLLSFESP